MADENIGFFSALWRYITFYKLRKSMGLVRAADRQFTGSAEGIRDAFDLHQNKLVKTYQELRDAISQVEVTIEADRQRLADLNEREKKLLEMRDGALAMFEDAQAKGDQALQEKHQAAFDRFDGEIEDIEQRQAALEARIKETEATMSGYLMQLTKLQAEIQRLPQEKAQAIADFVSSKKIVELNDRLSGLKTSIERGPIDAVLEENRNLTAKARVSSKLAGTDVEQQDTQYAQKGRTSTSRDRMGQMLAARKAEREAKTGEQPAASAERRERPEI